MEDITLGRLMSPVETREATQGRRDIPDALTRYWFMCGDVPHTFVEQLLREPKDASYRVTVFDSPMSRYATFSVQAGNEQVRYLTPLGTPMANAFLEAAGNDGFMLSVSPRETEAACLMPFRLAPHLLLPVLEASRGTKPAVGPLGIEDLSYAVWQLMVPDALPAGPGQRPVDHVHLVLMPTRGLTVH